jgi:hypothetical protein
MVNLISYRIVNKFITRKYIHGIARLLVLSIAILIMHCSPLSQIRSTRVDSNLRVQTGYTFYSNDGYRILRGNASDSAYIKASYLDLLYSLLYNLNLGFSVRKKAEIHLFLLPLVMMQTMIFQFELKVPVVHLGKPYLFRNIGVAPYVGLNYYSGEWSGEYSGWLGTAIGTHTPVLKGDIELVFQPSITYLGISNYETPDPSYYEKPDSSNNLIPGSSTFTRKSLDLGIGAIYSPFSNGRIGVAIGMTYKHFYYNHFWTNNSTVHLANSENDPLSFYTFISFSLVK